MNSLAQIIREKTNRGRFDGQIGEAILQHYGLRTSWLDAVDNLFVALWFASNSAKDVSGRSVYRDSGEPSGFLYFLAVGSQRPNDVQLLAKNGPIFGDRRVISCDLRMAHTSLSVRPHAQHGIFVRRTGNGSQTIDDLDLTESVVAVAEFPMDSEIGKFMRESKRTLMDFMFPPKSVDSTYKCLLRDDITYAVSEANKAFGGARQGIGKICIYGH